MKNDQLCLEQLPHATQHDLQLDPGKMLGHATITSSCVPQSMKPQLQSDFSAWRSNVSADKERTAVEREISVGLQGHVRACHLLLQGCAAPSVPRPWDVGGLRGVLEGPLMVPQQGVLSYSLLPGLAPPRRHLQT